MITEAPKIRARFTPLNGDDVTTNTELGIHAVIGIATYDSLYFEASDSKFYTGDNEQIVCMVHGKE